MKHTWKAAAAGALAVLFVSPNAQAQLAVAKVVGTCGTVSPTPHAGANYPLTMDITGTLCTVGGGSGGGGTSSNFGTTFPSSGTAAGFNSTTGTMAAGNLDAAGNVRAVDLSFHSSGNYVNAATVTTSANHALTGFSGPNALLKNYGSTQIAFHQAASSTTVTVATADGIIEPGGTWEIALGTGTNIATASVVSGAISGTGSLQIIDGTGLWSGSGGGGGGGSGGNVTIAGPLGAATGQAGGVAITDTGTPITANATVGTGGQGLTGWDSKIDLDIQAGFDAATNTNSVSSSFAITNPTSTLTLPATTTAYTAAAAVASNATAGSVVVPSFTIPNTAGGFYLPAALLTTNDPAWTGAVVQIDMWRSAPTLTNGDRGAYLIATGSSNYIGSYSCTLTSAGDGSYSACAPTVGTTPAIRLASGTSVFWTAQAVTGTAGATIASGVFTLTAELSN